MSEQEGKGGDPIITTRLSDREQVEKTADRLRDELLLTIEELERRRERALDVRYQVSHALEKNRDLLVKVGGAMLGLLVVSVGVSWWRARHREEILWKHRAKALRRAWEHPDRVASHAEERPVPLELGRKLVLIFATTLASAMAKRAATSLVPPGESKGGGNRLGLRINQTPAHA